MKEKDLQVKFGRWLHTTNGRERFGAGTHLFELKASQNDRIPLERFKKHQLRALQLGKHGRLYFKIPDTSVSPNPFDCFLINGCEAWFVCFFNAGTRQRKRDFFILDADILENFISRGIKSSLSLLDASELGIKEVLEET